MRTKIIQTDLVSDVCSLKIRGTTAELSQTVKDC
jgi:hypothetical protein